MLILGMDVLKNLNEPQKQAVLHKNGPLLVIAGAGAGKTTVITRRIASIIKNGTRPEQILAVTFTNKAAEEMKERVTQLLRSNLNNSEVQLPAIGTFHSVCARILRENSHSVNLPAGQAGLPSNFSILDKEDSLKIIKKSLKTLSIDPKQFQPPKIQSIVSKQKSNLIGLEEYSKNAIDFFPKTLSLIWEEYENNLARQKAADFDDLIFKTVLLFQKKPNILEKYQNKWLYILIDEYQDTNHAQYVLAKLLAKKNKNICVVGDEDQSIYSFRGANFGNILNFEKDYHGAKIIVLEQNYRSGQKILEAANAVIGKNTVRKPKNLFSELGDGQSLVIFGAANEREEANFIAASSEELLTDNHRPKDITVLYRANFQSRALEESFISRGLPYQVVGTKFFERKEVKDIIAYAKAAMNPGDIISLERIINEPSRGLGKASLLNHLTGNPSTPLRMEKIKEFFGLLEKIKKTINSQPLSKALFFIIKESGYQNYLDNGTEEGIMRMDNLKELVVLSMKHDGLKPPRGMEKFMEDAALMTDQDEVAPSPTKTSEGKVRLMTVHAAKGLEFPCVFIAGLEDGLFPYIKPFSFGKDEEEEERRLFYVALTRAQKKIHLSFAYSRTMMGGRQINQPSRFINEIPPELFEQNFENLPATNYLDF